MVSTLNNLWTEQDKKDNDIGLEYMVVDDLGAQNSIILFPNNLIKAELKLKKKLTDSMIISWELYPDYCRLESISNQIKEPKKITNAIVSKNDLTVLFETPKEEGPYRLYVYIENQNGFVATCNTPFYVLGSTNE